MESTLPPQKLKRTLAREVVKLYHGGAAAAEAADRFDKVFVSHEVPSDIAEHAVGEGEIFVPHLLVELGFADSSSDARRKITQGGVRIDDEKVTEEKADASTLRGKILRVGKRNFARLV
jgi:tyrosyl-tRNA synthetase